MAALAFSWNRAERRAASRTQSRRFAFYNGAAPRSQPASAPTCEQHHRRLPCSRCPAADSHS